MGNWGEFTPSKWGENSPYLWLVGAPTLVGFPRDQAAFYLPTWFQNVPWGPSLGGRRGKMGSVGGKMGEKEMRENLQGFPNKNRLVGGFKHIFKFVTPIPWEDDPISRKKIVFF